MASYISYKILTTVEFPMSLFSNSAPGQLSLQSLTAPARATIPSWTVAQPGVSRVSLPRLAYRP